MRALARHCVDLSSDGLEKDQAAVAALVGVSRARISQVMGLTYLAPDIQEAVLDLPPATEGRDPVHHRDLTRPPVPAPPGLSLTGRWEVA